ncbi:hypothetical protein LCGC14_2930340, partial [marine sediment metagenome]
MARRLSKLEVHQVKLLICEGFSQTDTSRALDISQAIVSKICMGDVHRNVPWPNPALGESLMRKRGKRAERDEAQARLLGGVPQLPEPIRDVGEAMQVKDMSESEAIRQALDTADAKAKRLKKFTEFHEELEKEDEAAHFERMKVTGPKSEAELPPPVSFWTLPFLEWEEVVGRAEKGNSIVEAIEKGDPETPDILKRAIGIVFLKEKDEDWDDEQTLLKISSVVEQLR